MTGYIENHSFHQKDFWIVIIFKFTKEMSAMAFDRKTFIKLTLSSLHIMEWNLAELQSSK
jgi:hypothetical protein